MVRGTLLAVSAVSLSIVFASEAAPTIDIATAAASWSPQFVLTGTKTEPTYIEHIRLERYGDLFVLQGGAPAGMAPSRESVVIDADGKLQHLDCPPGMPCDTGASPSGFLASAVIVAAVRQARLSGRFPILAYGEYELLCVPAEQLGVQLPVLDPCVEIHSGAVIAQRHRRSGEFDGPSLDPWSIELSAAPGNAPLQFN
jgi:hypothetical protein